MDSNMAYIVHSTSSFCLVLRPGIVTLVVERRVVDLILTTPQFFA
jgi:hypothetical protein